MAASKRPGWVHSKFCEQVIGCLNADRLQPPIRVPVTSGFSDDFFKGLDTVMDNCIWCGSETRRIFRFAADSSEGHVKSRGIVWIHVVEVPEFICFSVPCLPAGEIAVWRDQLPRQRIGSHDSETPPTLFVSGLQQLSWYELQSRYQSSEEAELPVLATSESESVEAGQDLKELNMQAAEGQTYDLKCTGDLHSEFHEIAWYLTKGKRPPTMPKRLSSAIIGPDTNRNRDDYKRNEGCLIFGISDDSNEAIGLRLEFDEFPLNHSEIFPSLLPTEVKAEKILVRTWPKEVPHGSKLEVYCGNKANDYSVIMQERGEAWAATHRNGTKHVLRYRFCESRTDQEGISVNEKVWKDASMDDFPKGRWEERHLLRLTVRPEEDSSHLEGTFFCDAEGFYMPERKSLACIGVWLRLRTRQWESRFDPASQRIEIGNCFLGNRPDHLFDDHFQDLNMDELKNVIFSRPESTVRLFAVESSMFDEFADKILYSNLANASVEVVLFVPLSTVSQRRDGGDDSRELLAEILPHPLSKYIVDMVPVLPYERPEPHVPPKLRSLGPFRETEKISQALQYYKRECGAGFPTPPALFDCNDPMVVWTSPMHKLLNEFYKARRSKKQDTVVEFEYLSKSSGVTTALSFVHHRVLECGEGAIYCADKEAFNSWLRMPLNCAKDSVFAVFLDYSISDPNEIVRNLKGVFSCNKVFLVYTRLADTPVPFENGDIRNVLCTLMWSESELSELVSRLKRVFHQEWQQKNSLEMASKALDEALEYTRHTPECAHFFLLIFVATRAYFKPPLELIWEARSSLPPDSHSTSLRQSPRRLFDNIAFVTAAAPVGEGLDYNPNVFANTLLVPNSPTSRLVIRRKTSDCEVVTYVHPFFARMHLLLLESEKKHGQAKLESAALCAKVLPSPRFLFAMWEKHVKADTDRLTFSETKQFYKGLFLRPHTLSVLAQHFLDKQQSELLLKMCEGCLDEVDYQVLVSKALENGDERWTLL